MLADDGPVELMDAEMVGFTDSDDIVPVEAMVTLDVLLVLRAFDPVLKVPDEHSLTAGVVSVQLARKPTVDLLASCTNTG